MISRSITTLAAAASLLLACTACSSKYSDVYSFKKNNFKAPAKKGPDLAAPPVTEGAPAPTPAPVDTGIPGAAPAPAPGVPGLEAVPGAAPAPAAEPAPGPAPTVPGL